MIVDLNVLFVVAEHELVVVGKLQQRVAFLGSEVGGVALLERSQLGAAWECQQRRPTVADVILVENLQEALAGRECHVIDEGILTLEQAFICFHVVHHASLL